MVHADVEIARVQKSFEAGAKNPEFLAAFRQVRGECALLLLQPGHVRVAEHRHAIGRERQHLINRGLKLCSGLVGQSVDQVHVEAFEAQFARCGNQIARHFVGLDAMNRLLHLAARNPECPCSGD